MNRCAAIVCALAGALAGPGLAAAASGPPVTAPALPSTPAAGTPTTPGSGTTTTPGAGAPTPTVTTARASGTVVAVGRASFTIQSGSRSVSVPAALTAAADALAGAEYAYVWGGGHAQAGVASIGMKGPGYNGRRLGFDCSGSVAAVLAGAGLWPAGSGVPTDAGIITQLRHEMLIARGPGTGADAVTLYDDPGVHIFMSIGGQFFGTSDGGAGNPSQFRGGPAWLDDGAPDASDRHYRQYHLLPSVLAASTTDGPTLTFHTGATVSLPAGLALGAGVAVTYSSGAPGGLSALAVQATGTQSTPVPPVPAPSGAVSSS